MKLFELLEVSTDCNKIELWSNCDVIAYYNGKDAISTYFNNGDVIEVYNAGGYLVVEVSLDSIKYLNTYEDCETTLGAIHREFIKTHNDYDGFEEFLDCATDMGGDLREL